MSEHFDGLSEMKETEKRPLESYSEEEKIARGIYCGKCLEGGDKVEIVLGTATCPRCYCIEHGMAVDISIFQRDIQEMNIGNIEGIEIGKTYPVNDILKKLEGCCDIAIGHAIIENQHLYFLDLKDLGYNGNKGKNITILSLLNTGKNDIQTIGSGKEYIKNFILDKGTSEALGRLQVFDGDKKYRYVVTDMKEIKSYGYTDKLGDAIQDMNTAFEEMKIPYYAGKHDKLIKIWRKQ